MITYTETDTRYRAVAVRLFDAMNRRERFLADSFFGGPPATASAKDRLRAALAASTDADLVGDLRFYFNLRRIEGDRITEADVLSAIRLLARA